MAWRPAQSQAALARETGVSSWFFGMYAFRYTGRNPLFSPRLVTSPLGQCLCAEERPVYPAHDQTVAERTDTIGRDTDVVHTWACMRTGTVFRRIKATLDDA